LGFIEDFEENFNENSGMSILVQKLRNAIRSLGHITGEVRTDDILDVIFKDFCIGK
jgi:tRNA modification GTPase